ncbi:hypothetical protein SCYAM73S_05505 [Streptomyces cyaneofuscatus]
MREKSGCTLQWAVNWPFRTALPVESGCRDHQQALVGGLPLGQVAGHRGPEPYRHLSPGTRR